MRSVSTFPLIVKIKGRYVRLAETELLVRPTRSHLMVEWADRIMPPHPLLYARTLKAARFTPMRLPDPPPPWRHWQGAALSGAAHIAAILFLLLSSHSGGTAGIPQGENPNAVEVIFPGPSSASSQSEHGVGIENQAEATNDTSFESKGGNVVDEKAKDTESKEAPDTAAPQPRAERSLNAPEEPEAVAAPLVPPPETALPAITVPPVAPEKEVRQKTTKYNKRPRPEKKNNLAATNNWSFDEQSNTSSAARHHAGMAGGTHRGRTHRGINTAVGPIVKNGKLNAPYSAIPSIHGANEQYQTELKNWIQRRLFYPRGAAQHGESGTAAVHVSIDRSGNVSNLSLTRSSGSDRLDAAILSIFRGSKLPPLPPSIKDDHLGITLQINYILIRR